MNLKVKTLHELMTLSIWLSDILDNHQIPFPRKSVDALRDLYWDVNEEITERLLKKEQDDDITA